MEHANITIPLNYDAHAHSLLQNEMMIWLPNRVILPFL